MPVHEEEASIARREANPGIRAEHRIERRCAPDDENRLVRVVSAADKQGGEVAGPVGAAGGGWVVPASGFERQG